MKNFRLIFLSLFFVIAAPTAILLWRSYENIRNEALLGYKENAYLILQILNQKLYDHLAVEENRSYTQYRFIKAIQVIGGEEVTLSELAQYPVKSHYPGIIGYFQVDPDGTIRSPLVPDGPLGQISIENRRERVRVRNRLRDILEEIPIEHTGVYRRVSARTLGLTVDQEALKGREAVKPSKLTSMLSDRRFFSKRYETSSKIGSFLFDVESDIPEDEQLAKTTRHRIPESRDSISGGEFEVEIDPFQARFDRENIVFFRSVWRDDQRFIQGFVVNLHKYLNSLVYGDLQFSSNDDALTLEFASRDSMLVRFGKDPGLQSHILLTTGLQYPLNSMDLTVYLHQLDAPPAAQLVVVLGIIMLLVTGGSFFGLYKVVTSQIQISRKRQDFISAVSHELKTPLTAIQMYGELLQNSWLVKEEKRHHYYTLIASEADRLSRLIQNVLNLSKLEKNSWQVNLRPMNPRRFLEEFVRKYRSTWEHKGFAVNLDMDECDFDIQMDPDACFQVMMNIVDNSLKFSRNSQNKELDIMLRVISDQVQISVRDYGPGIPPSEISRVFENFYRIENEMTRTTSGTGIGLSLVKNLCKAMDIKVRAENATPGLRMVITFPGAGL